MKIIWVDRVADFPAVCEDEASFEFFFCAAKLHAFFFQVFISRKSIAKLMF